MQQREADGRVDGVAVRPALKLPKEDTMKKRRAAAGGSAPSTKPGTAAAKAAAQANRPKNDKPRSNRGENSST